MAADTNANNQGVLLRKAYKAFVLAFEQAFVFTPAGTLCASAARCAHVMAFINNENNHLMIALSTGTHLPPCKFRLGEGEDDPPTCNKLNMLHFYAVAFNAYLEYAQAIQHKSALSYFYLNSEDAEAD
jgi:hypothetical protein